MSYKTAFLTFLHVGLTFHKTFDTIKVITLKVGVVVVGTQQGDSGWSNNHTEGLAGRYRTERGRLR